MSSLHHRQLRLSFRLLNALKINSSNYYTLPYRPNLPFYSAAVREQRIAASLSVCLSVREHISGTAAPIFTKYLCRSPVAMARSSSGGVVIHYVLPVLCSKPYGDASCMTSGVVIQGQSLISMNDLLISDIRAFWRSE